jgi:hypothetical protein
MSQNQDQNLQERLPWLPSFEINTWIDSDDDDDDWQKDNDSREGWDTPPPKPFLIHRFGISEFTPNDNRST